MLTFNPENHEYRWNGKVVPSVTQIMARVGVRENEEAPFKPVSGGFFVKGDVASDFGKYLHTIAEALSLGKSVKYDPLMKPWVNGIKKFLSDYKDKITVQETETMYYSEMYRYCGTWDLGGLYKYAPLVLDWKSCTTLSKTVDMQTAAYEQLRKEKFGIKKNHHRFVVQIKEDGYHVHKRYNDRVDFNKFISLVNTYHSFK